ncbi:hypothetical protein PR202_gb03190 [Eleusine coracana subsp. coracana]|uniref:Uncharacterized protein n=1 Tax=Eleusine coracana subsp. coracana TaxID=191504 RepID=A0AAV5E159_ELECO|nr:hypothetical protein PR202_gb03190 [Eleusine coracana subsp. coracana]
MDTPAYKEIPEFPYRFIDYTGTGFVLGAGDGSVLHFIRGLRCSPSGGRLVSGGRAIRTNGPLVAGRWGAYWAVYCAFETASFLARGRTTS